MKQQTILEKINVYLEIEQFSNIKYEFNKETNQLEVDRILNEPYKYPYAYGFIVDTLASDNDELDVLIITDKYLKNDHHYSAYIIGALYMEDEKGVDEKVLCVLEEDCEKIKDINDLSEDIKMSISSFFSTYKNNIKDKWSKVGGFINKDETIKLYYHYKV
jgi:inorganic pyrophosphatase